ncbi:MAG: hypothetical protein JXR29_07870 [Methylothermaceae bacterium]|nr:hypothetical protein [Methylothermaceae bacterium]
MTSVSFPEAQLEQTLRDLIELNGFSDCDPALLHTHYDKTSRWVDEIIKVFYDRLYGYEPTARVFEEGERPAREQTLHDWYLEVAAGKVSSEWWRRQWFVGLVHIKRKVSNAFMIGTMSRVQQVFLANCLKEMAVDEAEAVYGAFKRITDVVMGLIAEGYFENYFIAMERTVGFKRSLVQRMLDVEVGKMLQESRSSA